MKANTRTAALVIGASAALAACSTSSPLTRSTPDNPGDLTSKVYLDTRVVVTKDCAIEPKVAAAGPLSGSTGGPVLEAAGGPLAGILTGMGGRVIDVGIDALAGFIQQKAKATPQTVTGMSNTYVFDKASAKADLYAGCVTLVRGLMNAHPDASNNGKFSSYWQTRAPKSAALGLPLAQDPAIYLESHAVMSADRTAISFVPAFFYYGSPLDDGGTDHKAITVRYDLFSPAKGQDQTTILGTGSFVIDAVEPQTEITAAGFGLKHTPWFDLPQPPDPAATRSSPPLDPTKPSCLPAAEPCAVPGTFSPNRVEGGVAPVVVHITLQEKGEDSPFWSFLAGMFDPASRDNLKRDIRAIALPDAVSPEQRAQKMNERAAAQKSQLAGQERLSDLRAKIAKLQRELQSPDLEPGERTRLEHELAEAKIDLPLAECQARGECR